MANLHNKLWLRDIANRYGLRAHRIKSFDSLYRKNAVYRASTDKGRFLIKALNTRTVDKKLTKEQQAIKLFKFIQKLRECNYPNFPDWIKTNSGTYYVIKNGKPYYMAQWIKGRTMESDAQDYEALGKALALLHTICKDRLSPMSSYTSHQIKLFKLEDRLFRLRLQNMQKKSTDAKKWFRMHGDQCKEQATEAWNMIATEDVQKILSREKHYPALIHGDVTLPNIVVNSKGLYLIDWDSLRTGSTYYEIAKTLSNTTFYKPLLISALLRGYEEKKPLNSAERILISALFRLPREAWIVARKLARGSGHRSLRLLEQTWDERLNAIHAVDEWARK